MQSSSFKPCTHLRRAARALWVLGVISAPAMSDDAALYELTIETGMPHLEENLRYTTTQMSRCLSRDELVRVFPVLEQDSLKTCHLKPEALSADRATYQLVCVDSSGTTGRATWSFQAHRSLGTLDVKLGGKNMTFFQRVTLERVGACS